MTAQKSWRKRVASVLATATAALVVASGLALAPTAAFADNDATGSASLSWGIKASFRSYLAMPFSGGTTTLLGTTTGAFDWANGRGTAASDGATGEASFGEGNGVHFVAHEGALDLAFTNPRVVVTSPNEGELHLDVAGRKFVGTNGDLGQPFELTDVTMATLDLPAAVATDGAFTWTGAPATLTVAGSEAFGGFYSAGDALDPVTFTIPAEETTVWDPQIEVFNADGVTPVADSELHAGDKLVVKGTGFDPNANVGGRGVPIPATLPQGNYVVFGNFADNWIPSAAVPAGNRKVGSQGWMITDSTFAAIPAMYQPAIAPQRVVLAEDGSFTWAMTITDPDDLIGGNFGIYTYPAGGIKNASQELYVPLTYTAPTRTETSLEATPAVSVDSGTVTELKATVSAGELSPSGVVMFFNGKAQVGATQTLVNGAASVSVADLPIGDLKLKATFVPADVADFKTSSSAEMDYKVTKTSSKTTLKVAKTAVTEGSELSFEAQVELSTGAADGKVSFYDGQTLIGAAQQVESGKASVKSSKLSVGTHKITAKFTPEDIAKTVASESAAVTVTVKAKPVDPTPTVKIPFTDIKKGDKFYKEIAWMYTAKVTTGVKQSDGTVKYQPKANVTREAMAAFLFRQFGDSSYKEPKVSPFADIKTTDKFYKEIAWMESKGISTGTKQASGLPKYDAKSSVTREAMSAFLYRINENAKPKEPKASPFSDVKTTDKFFKEIAWMSSTEISTGIKQPSGKPAYAPKNSVTREAMAAFLFRVDAK